MGKTIAKICSRSFFEEPLPLVRLESSRLDGAFIEGVSFVSRMENNNFKLKKDGLHCLTFFSIVMFSKKNKVPQESIPTIRPERVHRNGNYSWFTQGSYADSNFN